ncbi:MAG: hypothetical protein WC043_10925 [Pseudobdellovibrionaceae bacterium]
MSDDNDLIQMQGYVHIPDFEAAAAPHKPPLLSRVAGALFKGRKAAAHNAPKPARLISQGDDWMRDFDV